MKLYAIELRESCRAPLQALVDAGVLQGFAIGDFLDLSTRLETNAFDYVVTNPPYSIAREFIDVCNRIAKRANVQLLRINFLGCAERREWTDLTKPGMKVVPNRPSFTGWGGDATEYAWFIYKDPDMRGRWDVLEATPADVIAAWNARARAMFPHLKPEKKAKTKVPENEAATVAG